MKRLLAVLIVLVFGCAAHASLAPQIYNPGFEESAAGWGWRIMNGCRVSYHVDTTNPHSGKRCLVFVNESGVQANVYGRLEQGVGVLPDTQYELSAWARGVDVGGAQMTSHFTDWNTYTLNLPTGTFGWQKVSTVFRTKPGQCVLTLGFNSVNTSKELAIDDIALRPIGVELKGSGAGGSFLAPARLVGDNAPGYTGVFLNSALKADATVEITVSAGDRSLLRKRATLKAGKDEIEQDWNIGKAPAGGLTCLVRVLDRRGNVMASGSSKIAKVESPISAEIDRAQAKLATFNDLYAKCRARKIPLDYPTVTKTLLAQFIPYAREDVQKGQDWRAQFAATDFNRALDDSIADMQAYLADPSVAPNAVRFRTGKVGIDGVSFIGDRVDDHGAKSRGPVFFCGYGHFGQVQTDMPRWPGYGTNIIQIEFGGLAATLPAENEVSLKAALGTAKSLDEAAKHNVRIDVLLSTHYFPQWALDKWPKLARGGGGFLNYCVDAPEAKVLVEEYLRTVIPLLKDKPALNSFCLTNEPVLNRAAESDNTKPMWAEYLAKVHGDVKTMNERYGTSYAEFEEVPPPGNESYDAPQFYDWCVFNQERFAAWHKWMADIVHQIAPNVPIHAKMMSMALPHRFTISWGCDPELFGQLSDINGNDCLIRGLPSGGWAIPFHLQNMSYDLQRSLNYKPVFNSENHPTDDRSTYSVPPEHFRTTLWQGAIHGQGATTFWVWERTFDIASDLYGNVMDRPGCAGAVGTTCLDLNRFAGEVTALQNVKAPVAIVFSIASITRSAKYLEVVNHVYNALNYDGIKIDFISEKQLAASMMGRDLKSRPITEYKMIIFPQVSNVLPATFDAVRKLPVSTRLVIVGESLSKDPYGKEYPRAELTAIRDNALCLNDADPEKVLWPAIRDELGKLGALPEYSVVDAASGQPVWGVEWLPAKFKGRDFINVVDLRDQPFAVKILRHGNPVAARDLLSLGGRESVGPLKPITPVLAEIAQ